MSYWQGLALATLGRVVLSAVTGPTESHGADARDQSCQGIEAAGGTSASRFRDRIYLTWTRFIFSPTGTYKQSPIFEAHSSDGGATFTAPQSIAGNVLYGQGSHPVVGPDGTVYVFWNGATRKSVLNSTYMVKSSDGGTTWSAPLQVAPLQEVGSPKDTKFRVNSFPMADISPTTGAL